MLESPERWAVFQVVGRRSDVSFHENWGDAQPRTQIVAIGAPYAIDADELTERFNRCLSEAELPATA